MMVIFRFNFKTILRMRITIEVFVDFNAVVTAHFFKQIATDTNYGMYYRSLIKSKKG